MTAAGESRPGYAPLHSARSSPSSPADPQPLVVGFDGSLPAIAALVWATGTGLPVIVVRVLDPSPRPPGADGLDRRHDVDDAGLVLGEHAPVAARRLADCAWRAEVVEACSPAAGLAASARRHGATAIVVGAGARGRGRSVMGNQLHALLAGADTPVVVVPTRAAARLLVPGP